MAAKGKVIKNVTAMYLLRDKASGGASTTLTAAAAAGASTLTVASITNISVGDILRVGSGEEMESVRVHPSTAPSGSTVTLESALLLAHASGEAVVEQDAYDIGDVTADGVNVSYQGESSDVDVATKRLPLTVLNGFVDGAMEYSVPNVSLYSIAMATGMLLSKVTGAGTSTDPIQLITDGNEFAGQSDMALVCVGTTMDGSIIRAELWSVDFNYSNISMAFGRGTLTTVPIVAAGSGGMFATSAPAYTALTTLKPGKGDVFDYITKVGFFADTGTTTTLNGAHTAGVNTLTLTSGTGFTANSTLKIGTGATCEFHVIHSVVTNTVTLKTRTLRAFATGIAVTQQSKTDFAGISQAGATLAFSGSVDTLRIATSRVSIGIRPGKVAMSLSFGVIQISLSNIAYALGIPQGDIVGASRLPIRNNIATTTIDGFYFEGIQQNAQTFYGHLCGCSFDVSQFSVLFSNQGDPATVPLVVKPGSALLLVTTP